MKLTNKERDVINLLVGNMMEANNAQPYDARGYEANQAAVYAFLKALLPITMYKRIEHSKENWNWWGNDSFADDAQAAIDQDAKLTDHCLQPLGHDRIEIRDGSRLVDTAGAA